jgi:hypothetical protein
MLQGYIDQHNDLEKHTMVLVSVREIRDRPGYSAMSLSHSCTSLEACSSSKIVIDTSDTSADGCEELQNKALRHIASAFHDQVFLSSAP